MMALGKVKNRLFDSSNTKNITDEVVGISSSSKPKSDHTIDFEEYLYSASRLALRQSVGPLCSRVLWSPIERDVIFTIEIPIGFMRDSNETFEVFASLDQNLLRVEDRPELKLAQVQILNEQGQLVNMECSIEVLRKVLAGELIFNNVAKGFKAVKFLEGTMQGNGIYLSQTAFSSSQSILFDNMLGYCCKECTEYAIQELAVTLEMKTPFIVLSDGTKVEAEHTPAGGIIQPQQATSSFDALLDGKKNMSISVPCHIIVELILEPVS